MLHVKLFSPPSKETFVTFQLSELSDIKALCGERVMAAAQ